MESSNGGGSGSKSHINHQSWSEEEQRRLEELLIQYPAEEVAAHRWAKIAEALGSRTPKQVASRTQKYFVKLHKLGLPVPGKPPNQPSLFPKISKKKRSKSTDDEDVSTPSRNTTRQDDDNGNKKEKKEKKKSDGGSGKLKTSTTTTTTTATNSNGDVIHEGYKCDGCGSEPIIGDRWKCEECLSEIDLCSKCHDTYEEIGTHRSSHHMSIHRTVDIYYLDDDYKFSYQGGESNYLDSNYK
eukprot:gene15867-18855_t